MGNMKILNTNTAIYTIELHEAKVVPFKKLEQAWTRTNGDKAKQAKLIKKYDLKTLISKVRPGSIKLGVMNKLNHVNGNATAAGTDLDGELIFITNNPLKIIYPKKSSRRPEGEEIEEADDGAIVEEKVEEKKSLSTLRLEKVASIAIKEDDHGLIEAFVKSETFSIDSSASEIKEAYKIFEASADWIIYDKKTGKQLSPSKSWRKWQGAKMAAAKIGGNAEPADAAWYHDNKAKLLGESTDLEEASATVQSVLKALRLKGGKDADALIKKMRDLGLESKVSKAHADAAKKILKGQITKFVKESEDLEEAVEEGNEVTEAAIMKSINQFKQDFIEYLLSLSDMPRSYIYPEYNVTPWEVETVRGRKTYSLKHGGSVTPKNELVLSKSMIDVRNNDNRYKKKEKLEEYIKHFDKALKHFKAKKVNVREMGIDGEAWLLGKVILEKINPTKYLIYTVKKSSVIITEEATWKSEGHYTADGKEWTGDQHEVDGQVMTGKVHTDDSVDLYHFKELTPEVRKQVAASFE